MPNKITVVLTKPAKSRGGDRYEGVVDNEKFVIYIPQSISRTGGVAQQMMEVEFNCTN
jgi:hypothetical protein